MELTLKQIKAAVNAEIPVYTGTKNYIVIKDKLNQYLIKSKCNNHFIGLTHADNKTLNNYGAFFIDTKTD